jgi:hypothetical protein
MSSMWCVGAVALNVILDWRMVRSRMAAPPLSAPDGPHSTDHQLRCRLLLVTFGGKAATEANIGIAAFECGGGAAQTLVDFIYAVPFSPPSLCHV